MPELKVPGFIEDLYYDLRERRLLPLIALAIVAIIAVPFLLSAESEPASGGRSAGASSAVARNVSELTVVRATPGLRDYRRRLGSRSPADPFKPRFTAPDLSGSELGSGAETSSVGATSSTRSVETTTTTSDSTKVTKTTKSANGKTTTTTTTTDGSDGGTPPSSGGNDGGDPEITLYSFAIDVKITRTATGADGSQDEGEPQVRHGLIPPAVLPGDKTQVVTYMGINPESKLPLLLVSDQVTAVYGEAKCLSGVSTCQLLEVEPGFPMTFVFGPESIRFKVNVLKVEPVASGEY